MTMRVKYSRSLKPELAAPHNIEPLPQQIPSALQPSTYLGQKVVYLGQKVAYLGQKVVYLA